MDWGLLQGLGEGLKGVGNAISDQQAEKRKMEFAQKLERAREESAAMRKKNTPASQELVKGDDGLLYKVTRGGEFNELARVRASDQEIKQWEREQKKEELGVDSIVANIEQSRAATRSSGLQADLTGKKLGYYDEDRHLDAEEQRSRIQANRASSIQRLVTANGSGGEKASYADYAKDYIANNPGLKASYVDTKKLTESMLQDAVIQVLREFNKRGMKPTEADFNAAISAYAKNAPKTGKQDEDSVEVKPTGM